MKQTSQPREDLRQRRTRKLLADALLSLLEERPLSEISVVDICQRAMVHRTTFYAHFDDKLALLRYAVDELQKYFEPVDPSLAPRTGPREYFMVRFSQRALLPEVPQGDVPHRPGRSRVLRAGRDHYGCAEAKAVGERPGRRV